jgi:hypothetical protein
MIQRYFLILTTGHTGSAWLAKLVNSHFEAMCFHELEFVTYSLHWPPRVRGYFEFAPEERLRNLLYLFSPSHRYGDSYQALGAIPTGVELNVRRTMEDVAAYFPEAAARARFFVLMRNPVSQIHSYTAALVQMAQGVSAEKQMRDFHRKLSREVLTKMEPRLAQALLHEMQRADLDVEYFLHACLHYLRLVWAAQEARTTLQYRSIFRLEDLSHDSTSLRDALKEITGLEYNLPTGSMEKVNVKSGGTPTGTLFQSWSPHRQRVFAQVFEPQRQALESLGYGLGNLTASSWNGLRIDALPSCSEERSLAAS